MDSKERMHNGKLYFCNSEELMKEQVKCLDKQMIYNQKPPSQATAKAALLRDIFAEVGKDCYIETPFHANWGKFTHLGDCVYANFNLTLVDDTDIYIDDYVMIGPNVTLITAAHPISPELRMKQAQYNKPVHICKNVWLGANVTVFPGVTIGENSVIGAGSLVTHDIPANVVAYGSPCRVARPIDDRDRQLYDRDKPIDL